MPINSRHPHYTIHKASVTKDAYDGNVKEYVPKLSGQSNEEYMKYVNRGTYFNATRRTAEAMVGTMLRKPFKMDPEVDVEIDENLGMNDFLGEVIRSIIKGGRVGIYCDYNDVTSKPYLVLYYHECITNWRIEDGVLSLVVLMEHIFVQDPKDRYELVPQVQYRELFLDDQGLFSVRIWKQKDKDGKKFEVAETFEPQVRGVRMSYIPFVFANPFDNTPNCHDPVAFNLAQLNISHFCSTVDLEHGVHFTALPQPYLAGSFTRDMSNGVSLGSPVLWELDANTRVGYLEFTGAGLKAVESRITSKENQMLQLGSSLLMSKNGVESADALAIRTGAETASMVSIISAVESAMEEALEYALRWYGQSDPEVYFEMNKDFTPQRLSAQDVAAVLNLFNNNVISRESVLECLVQGEIIPSVQIEMERLNVTNDNREVE